MPFTPLLGQAPAVELLTQAVTQNRVAPAYLFVGSPGVGKGLAARCFITLLFAQKSQAAGETIAHLQARLQQSNHPDLFWVEPTYLHQGKRLSAAEAAAAGLKRKAPPQIRLEQIREISQFLSRPPLEAPRSVVVVEQAETMAEAAANGLLKTLEEPGRQATLILMAPSVESLLPTLVSRCQRIPFYRLSSESMAQVLQAAGHSEILNHPEVLAIAQGSPGAAIASWEQLQAIPPEVLQAAKQRPTSVRSALELARQIDNALDAEAQLWLIDYLQYSYWQTQGQPRILHLLEKARQALRSYAQPRLVWEVTLMEISV